MMITVVLSSNVAGPLKIDRKKFMDFQLDGVV